MCCSLFCERRVAVCITAALADYPQFFAPIIEQAHFEAPAVVDGDDTSRATFPADRSLRFAVSAAICLASLSQLVAQVSWLRTTEAKL